MKKDNFGDSGYGKPPKHSQFKKGQSGNPNGRPKKQKPLSEMLDANLAEEVEFGGKLMTRAELFTRSVVNNAIKGKPDAMRLVMNHMANSPAMEEFEPSADDRQTLIAYSEKMLKKHEP